MPAVLVHGVPDTAALWDPIIERLARDDVFALRLPGFGEPIPDGFGCTNEEYAAWIVEQLRAIGDPVDLVGHDWGCNLVQFVGSGNPDLIRTWAAGGGVVDTDYVWHQLAQLWQTPEVGEQLMATTGADVLAAGLRDAGHPDADACAARVDDTMKRAILALYRSAVTVGAEWQPRVEANQRPALVLWGADDPYATPEFGSRLAKRAGAELVLYERAGHWAPFERPDETVSALEQFWEDQR